MVKSAKSTDKNQNINVFVRCRPRNASEAKAGSPVVADCSPSKKEISIRQDISYLDKGSTKTFMFDRVFGPNCRQIDVYKTVAAPVIEEVLLGYNCTIFAYGQTGTGKTFTMEGDRTSGNDISWEKDPLSGIIPRAMHHLFARLSQTDASDFSVRVSFLEIYNEEIFDLLGNSLDSQRMRIYDDATRKGSVVVQGLEEVIVRDRDEVYSILEKGRNKRQTAATQLNAQSSRSHSVFSVTIHMKENNMNGEELLKTGKLNLVDLAGSENIGRSGAVEKRAREAGTINQSLLTLGRVITSLVERAPHIPYRESKLTRLLQDSLGGRTKTSIIATVSPAACNLEETLSTLEYASRAKNIMNKPEINQRMTKKALIKEYTEEIDKLKKDLLAAREKNGIFIAEENYLALQQELASQKTLIDEYHDKITFMENEMSKVNELFNESKMHLELTTKDLERMTQKQMETQHLVDKHVQVEGQLYQEATDLLSTVGLTVEDITKLHAKLDRKSTVERENKSTIDSFQQRIFDSLDNMKDDLKTFIQKEWKHHQKMVKGMRHFVDDMCNDFTALHDLAASNLSRHTEDLTKIEEQQKDCRLGEKKQREEFLCRTEETKDTIVEETKEYAEGHIRKAVGNLQSLTDRFQATQESFCNILSDCLNEHKTNIMEFTDRHEEQSAKLSDIVSGHTTEQKDALEEITDLSETTAQEHTRLVKSLHDNLMASMIETFSKSVQSMSDCLHDQLQRTSTELSTKLIGDASKIKEKLSSVSECEDKFEEVFQVNRLFVNAEALKFRQMAADGHTQWTSKSDDVSQQLQGLLKETRDEHTSLQKAGEEFAESVNKWAIEQSECVRQHVEKQDLSSTQGNERLSQDLQALQMETEKFHESVDSSLYVQQSRVDDCSNELTSKIEVHGKANESWGTTTMASTDAINDMVRNLTQNELKEDKPTGQTPQRKEFTYPRTLTKTSQHKDLIQNFRLVNDLPSTPVLEVLEEENADTNSDAEGSFLEYEVYPMPNIEEKSMESELKHEVEAATDKENQQEERIIGTPNGKQFVSKLPTSTTKQKRPLQPSNA